MAHREMVARHALSVLGSDHRAFMVAVGHGDVTLDLGFTESRSGDSAQPFWRSTVKAFTDFSNIRVRVPLPGLRTPLRDFIVGVRGILHHESGHVRFTIPLPELWQRGSWALVDTARGVSMSKVQLAWNCLEDQRMEAAVVRATPRIATYFTPMVLTYTLAETEEKKYLSGAQREEIDALGPWLSLAGRAYLPDEIRAQARDDFDRAAEPYGVASDEWFDIVARYLGATDPGDMVVAVVEAQEFLDRLVDDVASAPDAAPSATAVMAAMQAREALTKKITNTNEQHAQMPEASGHDPHDSASSPNWPTESEGRGAGTESSSEAATTAEVEDVMARINERVGSGLLSLSEDTRAYPMPEHLLAGARLLAHDIQDALEVFRTERSPVWARHQEQGYLDAVAYRTRQPGDIAYRREPQHWETRGFGVHVSFLADRSESMTADMAALSQTLWAVKTACDALDIPSTMVLWSEGHRTVRVLEYDTAPMVYASSGGTDPRLALDDLDTHVEGDGLHHLVFLFTDGEWATVSSLTEWTRPERTFVIVGLHCESAISNKDAEVVIPITAIAQLGPVVRRVLEDHVARE